MKKLIASLVLSSVFTLLFVSAVSAQPRKPLRCEVSIAVDWVDLRWEGTIAGDIIGTMYIYPDPAAVYRGKTEHYVETWEINVDGGSASGFDEGIWVFKNLRYVSNGRVTSASGTLSYLIGCHIRTIGTTTEFLGPGQPLSATGTLLIH